MLSLASGTQNRLQLHPSAIAQYERMTMSLYSLCRLCFSIHFLLEIFHVTACAPSLLSVQDSLVYSGALQVVRH